ncbi:uncharacterized protein LOC143300953 [Babylonia areolata]|uniref:uncharacterized protein LOC143300953 n=1 Tax=Babylonia areolata TaxID=304850 RepID=UPI003FD01E9D
MDRRFFLSCALFATFVGLGRCLECHECVTIESDACLDPYDVNDNADNMGECDPGSHCLKYKTVQKIRDSGYIMGWERDSIVVTRACEPANDLPTGCIRWQGSGGFTIKCRCDTDGCNAAGLLRPGFGTVLMMMASLFLALLVWLRR